MVKIRTIFCVTSCIVVDLSVLIITISLIRALITTEIFVKVTVFEKKIFLRKEGKTILEHVLFIFKALRCKTLVTDILKKKSDLHVKLFLKFFIKYKVYLLLNIFHHYQR